MNTENTEPVCRLEHLEPADAMLIGALRNWAVGLGERRISAWVAVWQSFTDWMGPHEAPAAIQCFEGFMNALGDHARRTIHFHAPGCPCVDADEFSFLSILFELERGNEPGAARIARRLVRDAGLEPLLDQGRSLVAVLPAPGAEMPGSTADRDSPRAAAHSPPGSGRLH